ncbi:MAG: hypothetical protein LBF55_03245 [Prevotellaceae bacterium]|jgi:TM2 domain-containing membrane protein YozV|nr:hypothetical protein [Prevotellaceae bacterium]
MKKIIFIAFCLAIAASAARAQDIIVKKDGSEIKANVIKVSSTEVEYKKFGNPSGPTYTLSKSEIFMIKYQDGDKDVFEQKQPSDFRNAYPQHGSSAQHNANFNSSAQHNANFNRKSPGLAFLFSFLYPGIGQYYNGQVGKGVTMTVIGTAALVTGAVCAANAVGEEYVSGRGGGYYAPTTDETMLLISSAAYVAYFGTWLWSVIDAPVSAGKINRRRERGELSWNIGNGSTLSLNPNLQYATALNGATLRRQPACGLSLTLNF